jgi:hypothetical protein
MLQRQAHFVGFSYWRSLNSWERRKCTLLQWEVEKQERGSIISFPLFAGKVPAPIFAPPL